MRRALAILILCVFTLIPNGGAAEETVALFPDNWATVDLAPYASAQVRESVECRIVPPGTYYPEDPAYHGRGVLEFVLPTYNPDKVLTGAELIVYGAADESGVVPAVTAHYGFTGEVSALMGHFAPEGQTDLAAPLGRMVDPENWYAWDVASILVENQQSVLFLFDSPVGVQGPWYFVFQAPDANPLYAPEPSDWPRLVLTYEDLHVPNTASSFSKIKGLYQ